MRRELEQSQKAGKITVAKLQKERDQIKDACLRKEVNNYHESKYIDKLLRENERLQKNVAESSERERELLYVRDNMRAKKASLNRKIEELENIEKEMTKYLNDEGI